MTEPAATIPELNERLTHARFRSAMPPIHRASTVYLENVDELAARDWRTAAVSAYGRDGTPTTQELENALAELEGARHVHLTPSGLAAFSLACLAFLKAGARIALPSNMYGTGSQSVVTLMARFGVQTCIYEPTLPSSWAQTIPDGTTLVWIEAPGSITMEVPDIEALVRHARSIGALTGIDNTYSAGIHLRPFDLGIDVSLQALTKLQSGGSDVVMGSLSTADDAIHARLLEAHHFLGLCVSPDDAYLILRGLQTLKVRYEHSSRSAQRVADWFHGRKGVHQVMYPPMAESPSSDLWRAYFTAAAGLFSVALHDSVEAETTKIFVNGLKQFRIGYSWGGTSSIVMPYSANHPSVQRLRRLGAPVSSIVRFWVGLDDVPLLLDDLWQAWDAAFATCMSPSTASSGADCQSGSAIGTPSTRA
jgi:cystathionine beta-lyase